MSLLENDIDESKVCIKHIDGIREYSFVIVGRSIINRSDLDKSTRPLVIYERELTRASERFLLLVLSGE